jgi:hypothetical protein
MAGIAAMASIAKSAASIINFFNFFSFSSALHYGALARWAYAASLTVGHTLYANRKYKIAN